MKPPSSELVTFLAVLLCGCALTAFAMLFRITPLVPWLIIGTFVFSVRTWVLYTRSRRD